jgi:hypothetical protein
MSRIFLLGGVLVVLVAAGATALALKLTSPAVAQQHTNAAVPLNPAPLSKPWQDMREEMALP